MMKNIDGAEVIVDNILLWGETLKEDDVRLRVRDYILK